MAIKSKTWDYLKKELSKKFPNFVSTNGVFTKILKYEVRDLDWNHMDGFHRPTIHDTYHEAIKFANDKDFQFSLTRLGKTPLIIPVFDMRLGNGKFYQTFSIFNLFTIICFTKIEKLESSKVKQVIEWQILSHPFLKFLHKFISKKIYNLNKIQTEEDFVIRERRFYLRSKGFKFETDNPNYINSNNLKSKLIPPNFDSKKSLEIKLENLLNNKKKLVEFNSISFFIQRNQNTLLIWPGICTHEGAQLNKDCFKDKSLICPWHNLVFKPFKLSSNDPPIKILGVNLLFSGKKLKIFP